MHRKTTYTDRARSMMPTACDSDRVCSSIFLKLERVWVRVWTMRKNCKDTRPLLKTDLLTERLSPHLCGSRLDASSDTGDLQVRIHAHFSSRRTWIFGEVSIRDHKSGEGSEWMGPNAGHFVPYTYTGIDRNIIAFIFVEDVCFS